MKLLPKKYFHTGKSWFGCEPCDKVIELNYCSVTGAQSGTNPCYLSYKQFMAYVEAQKARKSEQSQS